MKSAFELLAILALAKVRLVDLPATTPLEKRREIVRELKHATQAVKEMELEEAAAGNPDWIYGTR